MAKVARSASCRRASSRRLHASASLFRTPLNRTPKGMLLAELPGANCCRDQRCSWTYDVWRYASLGMVGIAMVSGLLPSFWTCCAELVCIIVFSLVNVGVDQMGLRNEAGAPFVLLDVGLRRRCSTARILASSK